MSLTNFEVDVLASGSKGNSTLIRAGQTAILIDAGISCRRIVQGLKRCGLEPEDLSGVFLPMSTGTILPDWMCSPAL